MKNIFKKFVLLCILIITAYVVKGLLDERTKLQAINTKESFAVFNTPDTEFLEFKKKLDSLPIKIQNYSGDTNLPLREYCIKSSYNTAITGKYVSNDMIKLVLSRGCRFIDLEVLIHDETPVVSYTKDKSYSSRETDNTVVLDSIFTTISSNAFVASIPNPKDPLFVHLRVKSNNTKALKYIAASINNTFAKTNKLYRYKINGETTLGDIIGKIVVIIDNTNIYNFNKITKCTKDETNCYDLSNYISSKSNSEYFKKQKFIDILESSHKVPSLDDNGISDVKKINIGLPDVTDNNGLFSNNNTDNPDIRELIYKHGVQIAGYKYYLPDEKFLEQEEFFNFFKSGIVPFKRSMPYLNRYFE